ncbi:MAG: hypothetical protein ACJAVV_003588 [Alphaproteobacteria bacterium]|jgi:hypothetical protein
MDSGNKMRKKWKKGIRDLHKMCCLLRISGMKRERDVKDFFGMKFLQGIAERDAQNF